MPTDKAIPGWRQEVLGWVLSVAVPVLIAASLFAYLQVAQPEEIETPLWTAGGATLASVLLGFATWIHGVLEHRRAKRQQTNDA